MSAASITRMAAMRLLTVAGACICFISSSVFAQSLRDGSFEAVNGSSNGYTGWQFCHGMPDVQILDGTGPGIYGIHTPAAQGQSYIGMVANVAEQDEVIGQSFRMEAGMHFFGSIALFRSDAHQSWNGQGRVEIWAGEDCSHQTELLWRSALVTNVNDWQEYAVQFTPTANYDWLTVRVVLEAGSGDMVYLCLDDLRLSNVFFAVDYLNFDGQAMPAGVALDWETPALTEAATFAVQWCANGIDFSEVGVVEGLEGQSQFVFSHHPSQGGRQFYRLESIDRGGHSSLSEVRQVVWEPSSSLQVYPNPACDRLTVALGGADALSLCLVDMQGRVVLRESVEGMQALSLALPADLPAGSYDLQVQSRTAVQHHHLVVAR